MLRSKTPLKLRTLVRQKLTRERKARSRKKERPRKQKPIRERRPEFSNTRLGWLVLKESPVLYSLITEVSRMPSRNMIRSIAVSSDDPFFKTDEFWLELSQYKAGKLWEPSVEEELERIKANPESHIIRRKLSSS